jgi:hypothetical protein
MSARPSIQPWDWRYRVGFDAAISARVHDVATLLGTRAERRQLLSQLDAFKQVVSLSALIDAVHECPQRSAELLHASQPERLLHVPSQLGDRFKRRIAGLSGCSESARNELRGLLAAAIQRTFINPCAPLAEAGFGRHAGALMSMRADAPPQPIVGACVAPSTHGLDSCVAGLRDSWSASPLSTGLPIPEFTVDLQNQRGFAEYWPAELSSTGSNVMIVFDLHGQGGEEALQATIAHELLGHATFYEFERAHPAAVFDHGALGLIEGWATWCEWHAVPSSFTARSRAAAIHALGWLLEPDATLACSSITRHIEGLGYPKATAEDAVEYFFQYPLFAASYTLGALWFEQRLADSTPIEFFAQIQGSPWGDFFDAW